MSDGATAATAGAADTSEPDGVLAGDALGSAAGMSNNGIKTGRAQPGGAGAFRNSDADATGVGTAITGQAAAGAEKQVAQVEGTAGSLAAHGGGNTAGGIGGNSGRSNSASPTPPAGKKSRVIVRPLEAATAEVDVRDLLKPQGVATQA